MRVNCSECEWIGFLGGSTVAFCHATFTNSNDC